MNRLICLFIVLFSLNAMNAQETFKEGYYVDSKGNKVVGFIDDEHWLSPPAQINYRETADSDTKTIAISEMRSFSVGGVVFERYQLSIDKNPLQMPLEANSANAQPDFITITSFLKVLVKGQATLYSIFYNGDEKFFFSNEKQQVPSQLVYKKYVTSQAHSRENNDFRKQLYNSLNCDGSAPEKYLKLQYEEKDLIRFFSDYNSCVKSDFTVIKNERQPVSIKFTPFIGLSSISQSIRADNGYSGFSDASVSSPKFGADVSLVLPFNHNRYEIFARISYEKIKADNYTGHYAVSLANYVQDHAIIDGSSFQIGVGPRYNMSLNARNKLYIEANAGFDIASGSLTYLVERHNSLGTQIQGFEVKLRSAAFATIGLGYTFNRKIGIGITSDIFSRDYVVSSGISSKTRSYSAILRYTIN